MEEYYLDEVDYSILEILQTDSRITNDDLGRKLHRSKTPIFERVKRLERLGYINAYVTLIDYAKLRECMMSYIHVKLADHSIEALQQFANQASSFPEVMECAHLTGGTDFLLKVVTKNMEHYHEFLFRKLGKLPNIANLNSSIVIGQSKSNPVIPI
ncbi:Lrp/AsnC family transcriptional regulator [Pedobacter sp. MC2016-05]|uniref:Lrp/AsnC family transcriptional regulator n=1 Tax=Pedobacter sp. MC2016-05 TaxID=2994474 RepID=UPI002246A1D4|nr:Lrp/AsnC family transcriptional regulator [Pedobacter sp. MC2016-05]MCX2476066.1 Lrp/AsnC family transcriptional regulator [Pedobacter sp. MC2016-05]